jgi:hypothetical protein
MDPYSRPADSLSETEKRIVVAAFAAPALLVEASARAVPIVVGRPVLLSDNTKSDVLVVSIQVPTSPGLVSGLLGSGPRLSAGSAFRIEMIPSNAPFQQILLAGEQLWFLPDFAGTSTLVVSEVTP